MQRMNLLTATKSEPVDVTENDWNWGSNRTRRPVGIHCDAESTIVGALFGDAAVDTHVLPAGSSAYAFRTITTASTTKTGLHILYT